MFTTGRMQIEIKLNMCRWLIKIGRWDKLEFMGRCFAFESTRKLFTQLANFPRAFLQGQRRLSFDCLSRLQQYLCFGWDFHVQTSTRCWKLSRVHEMDIKRDRNKSFPSQMFILRFPHSYRPPLIIYLSKDLTQSAVDRALSWIMLSSLQSFLNSWHEFIS